MGKIKNFIKREIVLEVAFVLAVISAFVIHPDITYISYIDYRTLSILLALMITMAGFQALGIFRQIGELLVSKMSTVRGVIFVLLALCFFSSMLITNDVALITFVPFTIVTLSVADRRDLLIPVIVLETIAANLGSMATPIGNPQNLYLYSMAGFSVVEFLKLMLPYSIGALLTLIIVLIFKVKNESVNLQEPSVFSRDKKEKLRLIIYVATFLISLLIVARVIDYKIGLTLVVILVLIFDYERLLKPDYSLIFTFVFLFIFIGNIKRVPALSDALGQMVSGNEVFVSIFLSQFISNVPAAILCSGFTANLRELIVGVNFGGLGTLIASMASLISFKQYCGTEGSEKGKYILQFTLWNIVFLAVMVVLYIAF